MPKYRVTRSFVSPPRAGDEHDQVTVDAPDKETAARTAIAQLSGKPGTYVARSVG